MTIEVCLQCGEFKHGSSGACPKCGYNPEDVQSWAGQLLTTDQYHSREELEAIATQVKAGEPVEFDSETIQAGWRREEVKRLVAEHGTVPPPWVLYNEHPYCICWRMRGGESHLGLWWGWWPQQRFTEEERIAYFQQWPPPHCWLAFLIESVWGVDRSEGDERLSPYFERTNALGFGSQQDYERDLRDPKWLKRYT